MSDVDDVGVIPYHGDGSVPRPAHEAVAWLRKQIEDVKRAAGPKILQDHGHWRIDDQPWSAGGTGVLDERGSPVAIAIGDYAARNIVANDPLQALARCEAELAILDLCERVIRDDEPREYWSDGWAGLGVAKLVMASVASAYRHHPGYAEHWGESATPR